MMIAPNIAAARRIFLLATTTQWTERRLLAGSSCGGRAGGSEDLADFPTDSYFRLCVNNFSVENLLPTDWQPASTHHDREGINRARQNAEELFKPKQQTAGADVPTSAPHDASPAEHQPRRQPRIFATPPVVPMSTARVEPAAGPIQIRRKTTAKRETGEIPVSQFGRVHTLTSYGMTRVQVAEFYGVTLDEIDRIIRLRS
jgi:hypothetical protein